MRTLLRVPELTVPGRRRRVVVLLPETTPITEPRALLRSVPVPADVCWRYLAEQASFTGAGGRALPVGARWPFGPLRVVLADGSVLHEDKWKRGVWPSPEPHPVPAGARFECEARLDDADALALGSWLVAYAVHLSEEP
jgi:hypothetical protein